MPVRRLPAAQMARTKPRRTEWVIQDIAARGAVTLFAGKGGTGKTYVVMTMGRCVSLGQPFRGLATRKGKVVYIDAEMGRRKVQERVHELDLGESVTFYEAKGWHLMDDPDRLWQIVQREKPRLLVIDSLRRIFEGKETDADKVLPVLLLLQQVARKSRCAIILIHHSQRATGDFRGSSVIADQVDAVLTLRRWPADPEGTVRRSLDCQEKFRLGPEWEPKWLTIRSEGDGRRVAVEPAEPWRWSGVNTLPDNDVQLRPARDPLMEALMAALNDGQQYRLADLARKVGRTPKDTTVRRALDDLQRRRLIVRESDGKKRYSSERTNVVPLVQRREPPNP